MVDERVVAAFSDGTSDFFAALYQPRFSSKIAQMFSTFSGCLVAQLASNSDPSKPRIKMLAENSRAAILECFLEKTRTLLFRLLKLLQPRV